MESYHLSQVTKTSKSFQSKLAIASQMTLLPLKKDGHAWCSGAGQVHSCLRTGGRPETNPFSPTFPVS